MTGEDFDSEEVVSFENYNFQVNSVEVIGNNLAINEYVALKVLGVSNKYEADQEIDIKLEDGTVIGSLCTKPENVKFDFAKLTEKKYIAYLTEVKKEIFLTNELEIHYSYVVIHKDHLQPYYQKFYQSAPVWGNFFHRSRLLKYTSASRPISQIRPIENLQFPTSIHHSSAIKAILEPFVFERFLKKYHQIELLMDLEIVNKLKSLKKDLLGISNLFSELASNETNRLKLILKERIKDFSSLALALNKVTAFPNEAENIFQKYTKVGNPIKEVSEFHDFMALPSFAQADLFTVRKSLVGSTYESFIIELTVYWVYRIRNSIAHQRIGEYIITDKEEAFMLDFAEHVIDNVLNQIYYIGS